MLKITYRFGGRPYTSVTGLMNALRKDCGATEIGMVVNNRIKCFGSDRKTVVAEYEVSPPKLGEDMTVKRAPS